MEDVVTESRTASASDSVRVSALDCVDMDGVLWGSCVRTMGWGRSRPGCSPSPHHSNFPSGWLGHGRVVDRAFRASVWRPGVNEV